MDPQGLHSELYEEAQHLYRRRQELEGQVDELCPAHQLQLIYFLEAFSKIDPRMARLVMDMIDLADDECQLAEKLGPGWTADATGVRYSPFAGGGQ